MLPLNLQTSIVASCVPPFHCGALPITCGASSLQYGRMRSSTQPAEENGMPTDCKQSRLKHMFSENNTSMLSASFNLQHISENFPKKGKLFTKTSPSVSVKKSSGSDVVITQPTPGESLAVTRGNCLNTKKSARQEVQFSFGFEEDNDNQINHSLTQNSNANIPSKCSTAFRPSKSNRTSSAELPQPNNSKLPTDLNVLDKNGSDKPPPSRKIEEESDHQANCSHKSDIKYRERGKEDQDFNTKRQISCSTSRNRTKGLFSISMLPKAQEESGGESRSSWKQYKSEKYQVYSSGQNGDTQKLFTPDDLSNEMLYPNPYELDSEVYQNKHAKEADFVLNKPKRRPRTDPLPSNFKIINNKHLETRPIRGGLIEPLATEDDLALREGTKLFLENGTPEDSKLLDICSLDPMPLEAINFALENKIDNFEREEYVRFKRANKSDWAEFSDSCFILSLSPKLESKLSQINGWDKMSETNHIENAGEAREVAQSPTESYDEKQDNSEKIVDPMSRNCMKVNIHRQKLSDMNGEVNFQSSFQNLVELKNMISVKDTNSALSSHVDKYLVDVNNLDKAISHEQPCRETEYLKDRALHSETVEYLDKISDSRNNVDTDQSSPLIPVTSVSGDVTASDQNPSGFSDIRLSSHISQPKLDCRSTESHAHKRNTKHSKNVKYYKLNNHIWTSFDSDGRKNTSAACENSRTGSNADHSHDEDFETGISVAHEVAPEERVYSENELSVTNARENTCTLCDHTCKDRSHVPYEPLQDATSSQPLESLSPSESPSLLLQKDDLVNTGATRKETKSEARRCSTCTQRDGDEERSASAPERSDSSASLSPYENRGLESSDATSSPFSLSSSSSSSSSESTSSSSKDSSDNED